jgi:hypothetical protein
MSDEALNSPAPAVPDMGHVEIPQATAEAAKSVTVGSLSTEQAQAAMAEIRKAAIARGRTTPAEMQQLEALGLQIEKGKTADTTDPLGSSDAAYDPKSPNDYNNMSMPSDASAEARAEFAALKTALFEAQVSPGVAQQVWADAPRISNLDNAGYDSAVDAARAIVQKSPGGADILRDAANFLRTLPGNHPLLEAATVAACNPHGIRELARLGRRGVGRR